MRAPRISFKKILLLGFLAALPLAALAADEAFTVRNVEITHNGDDTATSKAKAIEAGEVQAFSVLEKSFGVADGTASLTPEQIALLVQSYQLQNEKTGPDSYSAVLTVSFSPEMVKAVLKNINLAGAKIATPEVLVSQPVIPVRAEFQDITEWLAIKDKLQKMDFIRKAEIKELTDDSAAIDIYYQAPLQSLPELFAKYGMRLSGGEGDWVLHDGIPAPAVPQKTATPMLSDPLEPAPAQPAVPAAGADVETIPHIPVIPVLPVKKEGDAE